VPAIIAREKAQAEQKHGRLEIVQTKKPLERVAGLKVLKVWLLKGKEAG
jgi:hypothetical protein